MQFLELVAEAPLTPEQLVKRDNWQVFLQKVRDKEPFELVPEKGADDDAEPQTVVLGHEDDEEHQAFVDMLEGPGSPKALDHFRDSRRRILLPTIDGGEIRLTELQKAKEFGRRGGKVETERQEAGLVDAINQAVAKNKQKPITLKTGGATIKNVVSANKVEGVSDLGKEPYADIAIHVKGKKPLLVSAKGMKAPSIAGGGVAGLFNIDPNIVGNAIKRAFNFYKKHFADSEGMKFPQGKAVEVYVKVPEKYVEDILKGTPEMGGPIDYMYIGPMEVDTTLKTNMLEVNGSLIEINDYMDKIGDLYLRIRRRRVTQVLDFSSVDKYGFPNIFYSRGEGGRRIVLVSENNLPASLKKKGKDLYVGIGK